MSNEKFTGPRWPNNVMMYGAPSPLDLPIDVPDIAPFVPNVPDVEDLQRIAKSPKLPMLPPSEPGPTRREFAEAVESIRAAIRELECVVEPMADTLRDLRPHLLPPTIDALHKENGRLGSIIGEERARAKRAEDLFAATGIVVTRDDVAGVFVARLDSHAVMSQGTTEAEAVTACMNAAAMLHRHNVGALAKVREREVVGYIVKDVDGQYVRPDAKADDEPDGKWQYTERRPEPMSREAAAALLANCRAYSKRVRAGWKFKLVPVTRAKKAEASS